MYPDEKVFEKINREREKKVYCKNCIWLKNSWCQPFTEKCVHPNNWTDAWKERVRRPPWEINKDNTCKLYKEGPHRT
jgi:hypothetical protein